MEVGAGPRPGLQPRETVYARRGSAGDVAAQLRQIAVNLRALLDHAAETCLPGRDGRDFAAESYIVYLRHAEDLPLVQADIGRLFADAPARLVIGDICRRELLIEVEAAYRLPPSA